MCNDTKENFLWEPEKTKFNVKFHKNCEKTGNVLKILCARCHFAMYKRMQYSLNLFWYKVFVH